MGKKRHSKDRLFITATEHKYDWGGKKDPTKAPVAKLPFYCCSLSLIPFENPVCTKEGTIFDIVNIIPFIKKYKRNPVTWEAMKMSDLIKLHFHKNQKGEYHDPVTFKIFTEFSTIVAVSTSGNVYAKETIEELNKKPKHWKDLMTDEPFTAKDLIVLQDPTNLKQVNDFHYIKNNIDLSDLKKGAGEESKDINQNEIGKKALKELEEKFGPKEDEEVKEPGLVKKVKANEASEGEKQVDANTIIPGEYVKRKLASKDMKHDRFSSGKAAGSFTSTAFDLTTDNSKRLLTADEIRRGYYDLVKSKQLKGYVRLLTNLGALNLMIHCDYAPKTGENFLELCEKKYYNNTKFHRLVRNFVIQGGDPTGTGRGGESIFGAPFEDEFHDKLSHNREGILSMANAGARTNKSQFFITLRACTHLDKKHSVFGEVVGNLPLVESINNIPADNNERPTKEVVILDTEVLTNPYREVIKTLVDKENKKKEEEQKKEELEKRKDERWIQAGESSSQLVFNASLPKPGQQPKTNSMVSNLMAPTESGKTKRTGFDFSNW